MSNSLFDLKDYEKYKEAWEHRQKIFKMRAAYYDGGIYDQATWWGGLGIIKERVQKNVRLLFNPLSSAVDVDAGIIPAEWAFADDAPDEWEKAATILFDWSEWDVQSPLYVHYGAMLGVSGIRVSSNHSAGRAVIRAADPRRFMVLESDIYQPENDVVLWMEYHKDDDGNKYEYAEVHTARDVTTYKDGVIHQYGDTKAIEKHNVGRVPIVEVKHIENGHWLSEPTFEKTLRIFNGVNEMLSDVSKAIKEETSDVQWVMVGAQPTELHRGGGNMWFLPEGAKAMPLVPNVDIMGMLEFIRDAKKDVKDALPENDFDELRSKKQIATDTLVLQLMKLVLKIKRCRPNYDRGLVTAMQIAGKMGIDQIAALGDDNLTLDSKRPLIPETRSAEIAMKAKILETVANISGENIPAEVALEEFGYGADMLEHFGTSKLATIKARQEDKIPEMEQ